MCVRIVWAGPRDKLQLRVGFSVHLGLGITSLWRFAEWVESYVGVVPGGAVLSVGWGLGRMEKDEEEPIECGSGNFTRELWMLVERVW